MHTLGIDIHKQTSTLVLIDDNFKPVWEQTISSHPQYFNRSLKEIPVATQGLPVAFEPVGPWRWISDLLVEHGMEIHAGNPRKIRLIAESKQKNDKNDALMLASLL